MPRVAFLVGSVRPSHCGVADYTLHLAGQLLRQGVDPILLSRREAAQHAGTEGRVLGAVDKWSLPSLAGLARRLWAQHPDVLHVQFAPPSYEHRSDIGWFPALFRLFGWRIPLVLTLHEYGEAPPIGPGLRSRALRLAEQRAWWDRETGLLTSWSDRVIVTNARHRAQVEDRVPGVGSRLEEIPIGPNVAVCSRSSSKELVELRRRFSLPPGAPTIVNFGFLHPAKGLEYVLDAFATVARGRPNARLLIVGGLESLDFRGAVVSPYHEKLLRLMDSLGIAGKVCLTDYLPDRQVSQLLSLADVAVLGFTAGVTLKSGSLLTLLSHGLPVVCTRAELSDSCLRDGENVLMVPPRQPAAMAEALTRLLDSPGLRQRLGHGALELAGRFTWEAIAARHVELYQRLLARRRKPLQRSALTTRVQARLPVR